jgi:LacI family transcriptional regulator
MDDLDYQPNRIARSLRKKQTRSLGLIVADITNPFYQKLHGASSISVTFRDTV